jgi:hypothetical protein
MSKKKKKVTRRQVIKVIWIIISAFVTISMVAWTVAIGF